MSARIRMYSKIGSICSSARRYGSPEYLSVLSLDGSASPANSESMSCSIPASKLVTRYKRFATSGWLISGPRSAAFFWILASTRFRSLFTRLILTSAACASAPGYVYAGASAPVLANALCGTPAFSRILVMRTSFSPLPSSIVLVRMRSRMNRMAACTSISRPCALFSIPTFGRNPSSIML